MRNEPQHDHGDELECFIDLDMGNEFVDGDLNMLLEVNYCSDTLGFTKTVHPNLRATVKGGLGAGYHAGFKRGAYEASIGVAINGGAVDKLV